MYVWIHIFWSVFDILLLNIHLLNLTTKKDSLLCDTFNTRGQISVAAYYNKYGNANCVYTLPNF